MCFVQGVGQFLKIFVVSFRDNDAGWLGLAFSSPLQRARRSRNVWIGVNQGVPILSENVEDADKKFDGSFDARALLAQLS